jgi:PTS system ascorbate-specific IIA component
VKRWKNEEIMSVSILLLTHDEIGKALLSAATKALGGGLPLQAQAIAVSYEQTPEEILDKLKTLVSQQQNTDGILILTDLFGSTPCNIANNLGASNICSQVVSGVNLPMLIRIFNYPELKLSSLAEKARSGGQDGVLICGKNNYATQETHYH